MPNLRIEDSSDIEVHLRPKNIPNPQDAYNEFVDILIMRCNLEKNDINEKKYEQERKGKTEIVHTEIEAFKPLDKFSKIVIEAEIDIEMTPAQGEEFDYVGDLEIEVEGKVRTEYPQESALQKSILWHAFRVFYEKVLYGDVKENYMDKCDKYMRTVRDELKSYFDMLPTIK